MMMTSRNKSVSPSFSAFLSVFFLAIIVVMAENQTTSTPAEEKPAVHIVYMEPPEGEAEPEAYHLKTLASVLGSEEAAKHALLYSYKAAAFGFSAKLTPEQAAKLSKEPGVLKVVPSLTHELHARTGIRH